MGSTVADEGGFEVCSATWASSWDGAEDASFFFLPLGFLAALVGFEAALAFFALDLGFDVVLLAFAATATVVAVGFDELGDARNVA